MRYSLRWLCRYVQLTCTPEELFNRFTETGTEVERFWRHGIEDPRIVVAEILSWDRHPNADRLRVCRVSTGAQGEHQIVCGATNFKQGDRVALALPGSRLPDGKLIEPVKIRGVSSDGMLCSQKELGISQEAEGIWILPPDWSLGTPLCQWIPADILFEIETTPNRPDLLCHEGLAREAAAIGCGEFFPVETGPLAPCDQPLDWPVKLEVPEACPYYGATLLEDVTVGPSPSWLQALLWAIGKRPINNVVDVTNFVLWELGEPLHAFDADSLDGRIIVRYGQPGESFLGLDGRLYTLDSSMLVIADGQKAHALAGILGGQESAIGPQTRRVLLESAWFEPAVIRRTARKLSLHSDAAYRFERRVDPSAVLRARDRAVLLLGEVAGARLRRSPLVVGEPPPGPGPVRLRYSKIWAFLGVSLSQEEVQAMLQRLGVRCVEEGKNFAVWLPPSWRSDLGEEVDLLEEIVRLTGTQSISGRLPSGRMAPGRVDEAFDRMERLRRALAARGWQECLCIPLLPRGEGDQHGLELANPISSQYARLRLSLKEGLVNVAALNVSRGNRVVRLFEMGRVFRRTQQGMVSEEERLGILWAGEIGEVHWAAPVREVDFYDIKGVVDWLCDRWELLPVEGPIELSEELQLQTGLEVTGYYAEFSLAKYLTSPKLRMLGSFQPLPAHPPVRRDLAILVPASVEHREVLQKLWDCACSLVERIELFDCFVDQEGVRIPAGYKSLGYRLTYRAGDRTLTDEEVNRLQSQLIDRLKQVLPCTVREGSPMRSSAG
ncbi:phenylalanine--tRNA ligase subunit beta [Candidatus Methylacidithermus pantelleriae]|uniref:Phenylalanine--tRNA ligase beta subunit n=1 Tax=Candidatus Methylacidithermus pantelleriae TaxID=2744239 RepID=A0A8J2FT71_9BACT|nr:phenylalanine--tRNA ligase subunit beta [Candidatus Methylacidithermus pantelleriae]CAF0700793.1 Phenylalanine--tRNA ligase beta subunit [Candidatus Methylacidithermus pantelleriae]